jgi:putative transposase
MLSEPEVQACFAEAGLSTEGRSFISNIRTSPPARNVGETSREHNMVGRFFSEKMGCLIQYESYTSENPFALEAEYDPQVLEIYDQPVTINVNITDKRGRANRTTCTPDYLLIRQGTFIFYEVKPLAKILQRVHERPKDWRKIGDTYRYEPGAAAFESLGCLYEVVVTESLNPIRACNIELLLNSRRHKLSRRDKEDMKRLLAYVKRHGPVTMDRAIDDLGLADAGVPIIAIDRKQLAANIDERLLSSRKAIWLATDHEQLAAVYDPTFGEDSGRKVLESVLETHFPSPGEHGRIVHRLRVLSGAVEANVHPSTVRRWKRNLANGNNAPSALASHYGQCGLRGRRVHEGHVAYIKDIHPELYATSDARSLRFVHGEYTEMYDSLKDKHPLWGAAVCFNTYSSIVAELDQESIARKRGGAPAGNALAPATLPDVAGLGPTYAFQVAQIDHYLADIFVVVRRSAKKIFVARPWVTAMIDVATRCVIGLWIGLCAPSRKACAMVIRDCVFRHGRVPQKIIVDNGSDFQSVHFEMMVAYLRITKEDRPAYDPTYGSEVERLFKTIKTMFLDDQKGNLRNSERGRAVARAFKGDVNAVLTMEQLQTFLEDYIFNFYNGFPRENKLSAPSILLQESVEAIGVNGVVCALDKSLMVATAIDAPSKSYRITAQDGIRIDKGRYRSSELLHMMSRGCKRAECRLEPYDDTFTPDDDAALGEADFFANLCLYIPSGGHQRGGDELGADIAFAQFRPCIH